MSHAEFIHDVRSVASRIGNRAEAMTKPIPNGGNHVAGRYMLISANWLKPVRFQRRTDRSFVDRVKIRTKRHDHEAHSRKSKEQLCTYSPCERGNFVFVQFGEPDLLPVQSVPFGHLE